MSLRVAMVVPSLGFVGGVERYAHDLSVALVERGHELWLLHGPVRGPDADAYTRPFHRVLPLEEAARIRGEVDVAYVQRAGSVEELEPFGDLPLLVAAHDHEHTCVRSHRYLPVSLVPCHRPPGPACVTNGCVVVRDRRPETLLPVTLRSPFELARRLGPLSRRAPLVACSRYVAGNLVRAGVAPHRVHVVHPIPVEVEAAQTPRPAERRLAVVGSLLRGKGVDVAIDALAHLPEDVTLSVVGDGPSRRSLEAQAARVAPNRVAFHGWVPPSELTRVYDGVSVVLVPARWPEPFGMTGIEAMRRGRPVVGARHGGIPEWLEPGRGGQLFEPGSAADLARATRSLLDDAEAGSRAARWARERFPHRRLVDEAERLLGEASGREMAA